MSGPSSPPPYVRSPRAEFLASLPVDRELARFDIAGSVAHVEMLHHTGLLTGEEAAALCGGLRTVAHEVEAGTFPWRDDLEDVHTNVESRLTELVGPVGGKLHTARSRNDQVALDERLYLRSAIAGVASGLVRLEEALLDKAAGELSTPMPGYTHLQRAQPVTVGHHLLAHYWRFDRDLQRLFATAERSNVSPLGSGALAGSTLPVDPGFVAHRLGFAHAFENSMDAVSDRDPLAELLFDLALFGVHASALGEEIVLFATKEFGFVERSPALGSGSSLMPQKRNPDAVELVRGKAGRLVGDLVSLLVTLKGLPLTYDRDLQEDKGPVLDAVETTLAVLHALAGVVDELRFERSRLEETSRDPELYATDLAEHLVRGGVPFRTAHESIGRLYADAGPSGDAGPLESGFAKQSPGVSGLFEPGPALERRASPGGPSPTAVRQQLAQARARLVARRASLSSLDVLVGHIEELLTEERR